MLPSGRTTLAVASGLAASAVALACGPSFQAIYEGNSRFERCYALEENPQASMRAKADCWREWSDQYTYGQNRDRIQYAIARYVALSQAPNIPTDEALMMAAPGMTPRVSTITAPTPTDAFKPPPKVLDEDPDSGTPLRRSEIPKVLESFDLADGGGVAAPPPGADCAAACEASLMACRGDCGAEASAKCAGCDRIYTRCMKVCFR
jgi:hypothetical protein